MLEPLRHFLCVAELGTFTAAARHLHLTQPALTASIQRLERSLGGALFIRGRRGAELTAAGQSLVPHARGALVALREGERAVREVFGAQRGEVCLGAGTTAITYVLPSAVAAFRKKHPALGLRLVERGQYALKAAVLDGAVDMAVVSGPLPGGEFLCDDELVLVHAPGLDGRGLPFLTFPKGTATRALVDRHFPEARIVLELSSASALKGQLRAGLGVSLLSRRIVETDLSLGRLVLFRKKPAPIRRQLVLVHRGLERLSPAAKALRTVLLARAGA